MPSLRHEYNVQPHVGILTEGLILLALDSAHASVTYAPGQLLVLDADAFPVPISTTSIDTNDGTADLTVLNGVIGKLVRVIDATDTDLYWTGGYELVAPVSGLDLPGVENQGILDGIDETTKKGLLIKLGF